jgi:hypothetical protein
MGALNYHPGPIEPTIRLAYSASQSPSVDELLRGIWETRSKLSAVQDARAELVKNLAHLTTRVEELELAEHAQVARLNAHINNLKAA